MKLLLGLFALVAARYADVLGVTQNSHREMRALWHEKGALLESMSATRTFHTLGVPSAACITADTAFQAKADMCLPGVADIFKPNSNENSSEVHSSIQTYCAAGGCSEQMNAAALALKTACIDSGDFGTMCANRPNSSSCMPVNDTLCAWDAGTSVCHINGDFFATVRMILGVFCLQSDPVAGVAQKYCIPSFYDFVNAHPVGIPAVTAQLTAGCDECTLKVFALWSRVEPLKAAISFLQLSTVCLKRGGEFCFVHQLQLDAGAKLAGADCSTNDNTTCTSALRGCRWNGQACEELWTVAKLTMLCDPCTLVYVNRMMVIMKLMDFFGVPDPNSTRAITEFVLGAMSYTFHGVCSTDLSDQFCMPRLQATPPDFTCAGLTNTLKTDGCCAPSLLEFVQGICNIEKQINASTNCQFVLDTINTQIASCAGLTLGKPCAQLKYIILHQAILSGVDAAWFAAHQAALSLEVQKAIAFAIGIDIAYVAQLKIAAATSGRRLLQNGDLVVTSTITMPQYSALQSANEALQGNMETLGINDAVQSTNGGSLGNVTLTGQTLTNIAVLGTSGASSATHLLAVAIAVIGFFL